MTHAKLWMRLVGALYLLNFVAICLVRAPIRSMAPAGTLALASAGDAAARFLVDTWFVWGLDVGVIGVALLLASRAPSNARALIATVIGLEVVRGIFADLYMIARGHEATPMIVWLVVHGLVIATGVPCLFPKRAAAALA